MCIRDRIAVASFFFLLLVAINLVLDFVHTMLYHFQGMKAVHLDHSTIQV